MGKIRRGGLVFVTWIGDHGPSPVHVYEDQRRIVKWDLENDPPMKGEASAKVLTLIEELRREGKL